MRFGFNWADLVAKEQGAPYTPDFFLKSNPQFVGVEPIAVGSNGILLLPKDYTKFAVVDSDIYFNRPVMIYKTTEYGPSQAMAAGQVALDVIAAMEKRLDIPREFIEAYRAKRQSQIDAAKNFSSKSKKIVTAVEVKPTSNIVASAAPIISQPMQLSEDTTKHPLTKILKSIA